MAGRAGLIAVCWLALAAAGPVLVHIDHLPAARESTAHALSLAGSQAARALLVLAAFAVIGLLAAVVTRGTIGTTAATAVAIIAMLIAASLPETGRWTPATWVQEWMGFPAGQASITSLPTNFWSRFISAGATPGQLPGLLGLGRLAGGLLGRGGGAVPPPGHQRMTLYSRVMRPWKDLATPRRVDLLIAAGLLVWGLPDVPWWWEYPGHAGSTPDVLGSLALTLAMSVPFCWRRVAPVPVLGLAAGVLAVRYSLHRDLTSAFAAVLVGAYGLGAYASPVRRYARWLGWLCLAAAVVVVVTSNGVPDKFYGGVLEGRLAGAPLALLGAAFVLGDAADARRREAAALVEAAHQAERTRIARELHDVVAHQLSAIAVQAGAARIATGGGQVPAGGGPAPDGGQASAGGQAPSGGPGQAEVLAAVERLAREALTELNHLLGALRREQADDPARRPSPTLAELGTLLHTARAGGVPAELAVEGCPRALSPGVELSCYRIIDEALTNVARHAPGAPTRVLLRYRPGGLDIEVASGPPPGGHRPAAARPAPAGAGCRGCASGPSSTGDAWTRRPAPAAGSR